MAVSGVSQRNDSSELSHSDSPWHPQPHRDVQGTSTTSLYCVRPPSHTQRITKYVMTCFSLSGVQFLILLCTSIPLILCFGSLRDSEHRALRAQDRPYCFRAYTLYLILSRRNHPSFARLTRIPVSPAGSSSIRLCSVLCLGCDRVYPSIPTVGTGSITTFHCQ